jgi:hypothetical protein
MGRFDLIKTGILTRNRPGTGAVFGGRSECKEKFEKVRGFTRFDGAPEHALLDLLLRGIPSAVMACQCL